MKAINIRENSSIRYIPSLDGVRSLSIIAVMLFHFTTPFSAELKATGFGWELVARALSVGWVGVDIFFVVSGFLIAKLMINHPIKSISSYRDFIIRRAWRLLPAYILCILIYSLVAFSVFPTIHHFFYEFSSDLRLQYLLTISSSVFLSGLLGMLSHKFIETKFMRCRPVNMAQSLTVQRKFLGRVR